MIPCLEMLLIDITFLNTDSSEWSTNLEMLGNLAVLEKIQGNVLKMRKVGEFYSCEVNVVEISFNFTVTERTAYCVIYFVSYLFQN